MISFSAAIVLVLLIFLSLPAVALVQARRASSRRATSPKEIGVRLNLDASPKMGQSAQTRSVRRLTNTTSFNSVFGPRSALKRLMDIVLACTTLLLSAPLFLILAILIRLDTKGPVFYRQTRIGYRGQSFEVYKLRSMIANAEPNGACYARSDDPRVTRVGRFIRKTRIDELPQAYNVLKGEMSFIGPRPERPEFVAVLEREIPHYHTRHIVKPGITGWAQVEHEYAASVEGARRKLDYDLYYIQHYNFGLDLIILLKTVRVVIFGLGAR